MAFRLPTPEDLEPLERIAAMTNVSSGRLDQDYAPVDPAVQLRLWYLSSSTTYSEWLFQETRAPDVRPGYVETMSPLLRGYCIPSSTHAIVRWNPAYGDRAANIITHEKNHALVPDRHPDPGLNEAWNRWASYSMTGDPMELEWFSNGRR